MARTIRLTSVAIAAAVMAMAAPVAAAVPRGEVSTVTRIDGRRARITLTVRTETPVVSAYMSPEEGGPSGVFVRGGTVEAFVSVDMLDNQPIPEGLVLERVRLVRVTPDQFGRRTWNPVLQTGTGAAAADLLFAQAVDGPPWETGARVDARVRVRDGGAARVVELGRLRIGGDFTLAP